MSLPFIIGMLVLAPPAQPEIQRPSSLDQPSAPTPSADPASDTVSTPAPAEGSTSDAADENPEATPEPSSEDPKVAEPQVEELEVAQVAASEVVEPAPQSDAERFIVSEGAGAEGPPYYDAADVAALRERHEIHVEDSGRTSGPRWRCLIADPACGRSFEVNALAAYTYRGRQANVAGEGSDPRWSSGRAQYDVWMNFPVLTEVAGDNLFTRMTLGPKGGLIFSDGGSTWGNVGMASRFWLGRGRWAPSVEFSSALTFRIGERTGSEVQEEKWRMSRGPLGFTADVGIGIGGFGAIVIGGQYDSPLAREDVPEQYRTAAGGAFFVGFRGNILWGGPAVAAVTTHAVTQRSVETP